MKNKKLKIPLLTVGSTLLVMVGLFFLSLGNIAQAYTCASGYEYHTSDGECWKLNYTERDNVTPPAATVNGSGVYACPDGSSPTLGSDKNECSAQSACTAGDAYHSDTNSCWYDTVNGVTQYTSEDTNKIPPTNNDGTPITGAEASCTDGFKYVATGGPGGAGCYQVATDGSLECNKPDQTAVDNNDDGSVDCEDGNSHLVPLNKDQSADTTVTKPPAAAATACSDGSTPDATTGKCANGSTPQQQTTANAPPTQTYQQCGQYSRKVVTPGSTAIQTEKIQTNLISCNPGDEGVTVIGDVLKFGVSALTVLVGVGAVGGIAWESLQYARAQDDSGTVSQARSRIRDIVIGLVVYIFMVAVINWLVPGGVIGG